MVNGWEDVDETTRYRRFRFGFFIGGIFFSHNEIPLGLTLIWGSVFFACLIVKSLRPEAPMRALLGASSPQLYGLLFGYSMFRMGLIVTGLV